MCVCVSTYGRYACEWVCEGGRWGEEGVVGIEYSLVTRPHPQPRKKGPGPVVSTVCASIH